LQKGKFGWRFEVSLPKAPDLAILHPRSRTTNHKHQIKFTIYKAHSTHRDPQTTTNQNSKTKKKKRKNNNNNKQQQTTKHTLEIRKHKPQTTNYKPQTVDCKAQTQGERVAVKAREAAQAELTQVTSLDLSGILYWN